MRKVIYDAILKEEEECKLPWKVPNITMDGKKELWWDKAFNLLNKVNHNKPDLVIWNKEILERSIRDFNVPLIRVIKRKSKQRHAITLRTTTTVPKLQLQDNTYCCGNTRNNTEVTENHIENICLNTSIDDIIKKYSLQP